MTTSPDVVVRPAWPVDVAPAYPGAPLVSDLDYLDDPDVVRTANFDLWTFQTALRWQHPSVPATGFWSRTLEQFVPEDDCGRPTIDETAWNAAMDIRIGPDGPLAVYRPPWCTARAPDLVATEADLSELVVPVGGDGSAWVAYAEPCTVEVLVHHRDSAAVPAGGASATLLWRAVDDPGPVLDSRPDGIVAHLTHGGPAPAGWQVERRVLPVPLDARLPRAVAIDVDLSGCAPGRFVLLLAYVESTADDQPRAAPAAGTARSVTDLVRNWSSIAARLVSIESRDGSGDGGGAG
jgi:hypothetical protein